MRSLVLRTIVAAAALGAGAAVAGDGRTTPEDTDLSGGSCSGHAKAADRAARLPTEVRETIVLWPRAGKRKVDGDCQSVTRFTLVNHTGQVVTVSFIQLEEGAAVPADGWEVIEEAPVRARFRVTQDALGAGGEPPGARWFIESESAPATSQETLESILGFFDPVAVARTIITGEKPDAGGE